MKNKRRLLFRVLVCASVLYTSIAYCGDKSRWDGFDQNLNSVIERTSKKEVTAASYQELMKGFDVESGSDPEIRKALLDSANWLGFAYVVLYKAKHPEASSEQAQVDALSLLYKQLNSRSPYDFLVHAYQMKKKYPQLWKLNVDTY